MGLTSLVKKTHFHSFQSWAYTSTSSLVSAAGHKSLRWWAAIFVSREGLLFCQEWHHCLVLLYLDTMELVAIFQIRYCFPFPAVAAFLCSPLLYHITIRSLRKYETLSVAAAERAFLPACFTNLGVMRLSSHLSWLLSLVDLCHCLPLNMMLYLFIPLSLCHM